MTNPLISIIVPVYNAEKYLSKCLDIIVAQSFADWECLLIDDGSPDGSGKICDEYATRDTRFRVFHKKNGGVSSARNLGLDNARGEWITFIDADDLISNNYCNAIENSTVDIIFVRSRKFFSDKNDYVDIFSKPLQIISDRQEQKKLLSKYVINLAFRVPWGKFIKRSLIENTRFVIGQKIGEDTIFMYGLYKDTTSIQFCDNSTYFYRAADSPFYVRYRLDVSTCILYLSRIYEAYKNLYISNPKFESLFLAIFFKMLDKDDLSRVPSKWFSAPVVKEMEQYALPMWRKRKKNEYLLWKNPRIAKMYFSILGFLRRILKQ